MMRRSLSTFIFAGGITLLCLPAGTLAWASSSVGFDVSSGVGTFGSMIEGALDLPSRKTSPPMQISLSYANQHSTSGTDSRSNQYTFGLSQKADDHLEGHGSLNYWKDTVNDIHYIGPSLGFTYTWLEPGAPSAAEKPDVAPEAPTAEGPTLESKPEPNETAALSINADIFLYGTEISASSTTRRVFDPTTHRFVDKTIPGGTGDVHVTQFHPSITFEVPLWESALTPSLTAGHYFYSKNPAALEGLTGRPRFSGSANQINGLVGGFLNNNGEADLHFTLPGKLETTTRIGAEQSATDNKWATTQGVTLNRTFFDHLTAKLDWSRAIQAGNSSDVFTGGLTYGF